MGLTQQELSEAAGVSKRTVVSVEKGETGSSRTQNAIARRLGWERGSVEQVLDGGDPQRESVQLVSAQLTPRALAFARKYESASPYDREILERLLDRTNH